MDDKERFDGGMKKRRKMLGDAWVDRSIQRKNEFNADYLDLMTRYCWGDVWLRPHLDDRTRRIIVIAATAAMGRWEEFRIHTRAAVTQGGFSKEDIKEILLQLAIYCGVPTANTGFNEAAAVFADIEKGGG